MKTTTNNSLLCNARYCINKVNTLGFLERKKKHLSLVIGALVMLGGVWLTFNFSCTSDVIPEVIGGAVGYGLHAVGFLPFLAYITDSKKTILPKTEELIKFYRRGYFITNNHTPTQCTVIGWKGYRYKVTIEAGNKLDTSGFLIDHNEVHKTIEQWVDVQPMLSCEQTLMALCYRIGDLIIDYGVDLRRLGLEIAPVDHTQLHEVNGELEPISNGELLQAMPAGAEYWCTFPSKQ